jgi:hypothetical protein
MENLELQTSNTFEYNRVMRGFIIQLVYMESQIYRFLWCFAFSRKYKYLHKRLKDQYESLAGDYKFFLKTKDEYVKHGVYAKGLFSQFREDFEIVNDIDARSDLNDPELIEEAERFQALTQLDLTGMSYRELGEEYEQSLVSYMKYLYMMAGVFERKFYHLPENFLQDLDIDDPSLVPLIDTSSVNGALFYDFIETLMPHVDALRQMNSFFYH